MATSHGIVTQDAPTSLQTQDYTKTALGTIIGAILLGSEDTPVNTNFIDVQMHIGTTDLGASNNQMAGWNYEDAQATSDVKSLMTTSRLLALADAGTDVEDEGCTFDSVITDGLRVDWDNVQSARLCTALLLKEGIANLDARMVVLNGTGVTTVTPGFTADIIIAVSVGDTGIVYGPNSFKGGVQFYHRVDDVYAGMHFSATYNDASPDSSRYYTTANIGGEVNTANSFINNHYTLGNFTSTAFDATKVSLTEDRVVMFISIKLAAGYTAKVGRLCRRNDKGSFL